MYFKLASMAEIQIGTDGWKAIIASDFTVENLQRAAQGTAEWMLTQKYKKVVIGFDCRFGGKMFSRKVAKIMAAYGFEVLVDENFITSSMLSHGLSHEKADLGLYITGGRKPYFFSGYKLVAKEGENLTHNVEKYIPVSSTIETDTLNSYKSLGKIKVIDLEELYYERAMKEIDFAAIQEAGLRVVVDAMYGAAHKIWERLLPGSLRLRCEHNPLFREETPDPIPSELQTLSYIVRDTPYTSFGVAFGGAAEKIVMCDETGKFIEMNSLQLNLPSLSMLDDGIWIVLTILQEIAHTGKKLSEF